MTYKQILITGVSSGLGNGLARAFLENGSEVYGCSRRRPEELIDLGLNHLSIDLNNENDSAPAFKNWISKLGHIDLLILNAGVLCEIKDMRDCQIKELKKIMEINLWSNKWILDSCLRGNKSVGQVVGISSGASLSGSRGWNGYSISKAALNMLIKLYSGECPETHFTSLAPGLVDTAMQDYLTSLPCDERYPPIKILKKAKGTKEMPDGYDCANKLINIFPKLISLESGSYADIRKL